MAPSEYIREHALHAPAARRPARDPSACAPVDQLGSDDLLMFSTDYPHWHFDDAEEALPAGSSRPSARGRSCPRTPRLLPPIERAMSEVIEIERPGVADHGSGGGRRWSLTSPQRTRRALRPALIDCDIHNTRAPSAVLKIPVGALASFTT